MLQLEIHDQSIGSEAKQKNRDCAVRAISKVTGMEYDHVYCLLQITMYEERKGTRRNIKPCHGTSDTAIDELMINTLGWKKIFINKTFNARNIPMGNVLCLITRHAVAVKDHVAYDTYDSIRTGRRRLDCIYVKS